MRVADRLLSQMRLPVIGAPMFILSNPELVIAQCRAGIVGSFPALNARPAAALDDWLTQIDEALAMPDKDKELYDIEQSGKHQPKTSHPVNINFAFGVFGTDDW